MSLEDQYDAWVRSVTGTGRHSATKQDRDAAQNSLNAMPVSYTHLTLPTN